MQLSKNKFKQGLACGQTQYGLWLGIADNTVAEICAGAGFDWLLIDREHAPFELSDVLTHLQVLAAYPVAPIVRAESDDSALLKRLLDIGAESLLIPMVETVEQAQKIVQAVKYPPQGLRGLGTSLARAAKWGAIKDYVNTANEEICLILQIESLQGLQNLEAIAGLEGVDGIFIGPSDLSASMGFVGQANHPDVVETIKTSLQKIKALKKYAGILCLDTSLSQDYIAAGADFVGAGVDTMLLRGACQQALNTIKQVEGEDSSSASY